MRADTLTGFLARGRFTGQVRAYYFTRDYAAASPVNARAFALAGLFNYRTAKFLDGLSLGASFFTANALGTRSRDFQRIDTTLMGVTNALDTLGEAFVNYRGHGVRVRLGDQQINTPWLGASDSRALPATYRGIYASFDPVANLTLVALRVTAYKGRTSAGFFPDNNYYPPQWHGNANYGGVAILPAGARGTPGTLAFGVTYRRPGLDATAWYYRFFGFAHMLYGQIDATVPVGSPVRPFIGVQGVREWGAASRFAGLGTRFFGQPGTTVENLTLGGLAGVRVDGVRLSLAYDELRREGAGALGSGVLISPYTAGYATDPLYTTSMIRGMVELGPGHAWKVRVATAALAHRLLLAASYAAYRTDFQGRDTELYVDVIFRSRGVVKGLTLRERLGISQGEANPGRGRFIYNRVMVTYAF